MIFRCVTAVDSITRRLADRPVGKEEEEEAFEDEIRSIVTEGLHDGVLAEDARGMIEVVIELGDADVSDIMTPAAFTVGSEERVRDVAKFLLQGRIHRALVVEDEKLKGIVTAFDLLKALVEE